VGSLGWDGGMMIEDDMIPFSRPRFEIHVLEIDIHLHPMCKLNVYVRKCYVLIQLK